MQLDIREAKAQFSALVAAVERGEKVTVCRDGEPVMECVPAHQARPAQSAQLAKSFPFGAWGELPRCRGSLEHMVGPTDAALLDEMGL